MFFHRVFFEREYLECANVANFLETVSNAVGTTSVVRRAVAPVLTDGVRKTTNTSTFEMTCRKKLRHLLPGVIGVESA